MSTKKQRQTHTEIIEIHVGTGELILQALSDAMAMMETGSGSSPGEVWRLLQAARTALLVETRRQERIV